MSVPVSGEGMAPDAEASWVPPVPLEWRAVVAASQHGRRDPSLRINAHDAWRAVRYPSGIAEVRIVPEGVSASAVAGGAVRARSAQANRGAARGMGGPLARQVRFQAWGPGAAEALQDAPDWLGRSDDWSEFDSLTDLPALVQRMRSERPGLLLGSSGALSEHLAAAILAQKVTAHEAFGAWLRLVTRFGDPSPGPMGRTGELFVPPTGAGWRRIPSWEWHQARVDSKRRNTLVRALERESALRRLQASVPAGGPNSGLLQIESALRSIPGVGVWTAAEVLQRSHGSGDHVSFGDYHVAHNVGWALTGRRVTDREMEQLLAPWTGHRQRVVRLLAEGGATKQRMGPRLHANDHRWH